MTDEEIFDTLTELGDKLHNTFSNKRIEQINEEFDKVRKQIKTFLNEEPHN